MDVGFIRTPFCGQNGCAEVGFHVDGEYVSIRSSNAPDQIVTLTKDEFKDFALAIKAGEFDQFLVRPDEMQQATSWTAVPLPAEPVT